VRASVTHKFHPPWSSMSPHSQRAVDCLHFVPARLHRSQRAGGRVKNTGLNFGSARFLLRRACSVFSDTSY
jgi:hypothetical protein